MTPWTLLEPLLLTLIAILSLLHLLRHMAPGLLPAGLRKHRPAPMAGCGSCPSGCSSCPGPQTPTSR